MVRLKALVVFPNNRLRRVTYVVTAFFVSSWLIMPGLDLQGSTQRISSEGTVKYPKHELGIWDVDRGATVPEEVSWVVTKSPAYGKINTLENPSFELDFPGWYIYTPSGRTPLSVSLSAGYVGRSLRLTSNELGYRGGAFQSFSNVPPNTTFHFRAVINTVDVEALETSILYWEIFEDKNWVDGGKLKQIGGSTDWTPYETTFKTPDKVTRVAVFPALVYNRGEVWMDETSLITEGWQPPTIPVILNWYTLRSPWINGNPNQFKSVAELEMVEEALKTIPTENFWGIFGPCGIEEIYRTHISFVDDLDTMWFSERLLGYPLYLQEKPTATIEDWKDEMYLRMIRGFHNYFSPLTRVGITWGHRDPNVWNKYYGEPATIFVQQHYDFLVLYPYTTDLEDWLRSANAHHH